MQSTTTTVMAERHPATPLGVLETEVRSVLAALRETHLALAATPDPQGPGEAALHALRERREAIGRRSALRSFDCSHRAPT